MRIQADGKQMTNPQQHAGNPRFDCSKAWLSRRLLIACVVFLLLSAATRLNAQAPGPLEPNNPANASGAPATLRQTQPEFLVRAEVNHSTRQYREGDYFNVRVVSEADAYVYVVYQQADGQVFQIYPNAKQPDNRLKARQAVQIPASDDSFRWQITGPFGKELVKVIASKEPINALNAQELRAKRFNPLPLEVLKGVGQELGAEQSSAWTEVETPILTVPRDHSADVAGKKRFGIFFGVAEHMFNTDVEAATGRGINLASPHRDARQLSDLLREVGQLNDARVYTNDQATRKNLEIAVTQWLPSVSRPGDTVVIYYSGHGGTLDGPRKTHYLVPHDYFSLDAAVGLKKRQDAGQPLSQSQVSYLDVAKQLLKSMGAEKANTLLTQKTGVTDVEFGHWLQRLDGRQVIVVLDVCFAGGFATQEKGLEQDNNPKQFRFLEDQMVSLKSIGQPESALLAASRADQLSQVRKEQDLSVMTFALIDSLRSASGPVTLQQAFEDCDRDMKRYFSERNIPGHEPKLFNYCTRPVFLKP